MKKTMLITLATVLVTAYAYPQAFNEQPLRAAVAKLDNADNVESYRVLADEFLEIANLQQTAWLPFYYAAFCNAKIGWLNQEDPDNIEAFADKAEEQIKQARSLLDTNKQKKELSEIYSVLSMINRARVFINPMTYGRKYGPAASQYIKLAKNANPDNPRALYLDGWEKYATPKMWGGDKSKAKELLTVARQKLESNRSSGIEPHWGKKEVDGLLKQLK